MKSPRYSTSPSIGGAQILNARFPDDPIAPSTEQNAPEGGAVAGVWEGSSPVGILARLLITARGGRLRPLAPWAIEHFVSSATSALLERNLPSI